MGVHPSLPEFARLLAQQGKGAEAESHLTAALERSRASGRGDPWTLARCEQSLADLYAGRGLAAEAEPLYRAAIGQLERVAGEAQIATAGMLASLFSGLARLCRESSREREAEELEGRARALVRQ